jgi:hypothetical protein
VYLLNVEACPDVDEHPVGVGEVALDVERVGERDEDGFVLWLVSAGMVPSGLTPATTGTYCQTTTSPT